MYYWCTRTDETAWEPPSLPSLTPSDIQVVAIDDSSGSSDAFDAQSLMAFRTASSSAAYQMVGEEDSFSSGAFEEAAVPSPKDEDSGADIKLPGSESEMDSVGTKHGNPFAPGSSFFWSASTAQRYPVHENQVYRSTLIPLANHSSVGDSGADKEHRQLMNPFSATAELSCDTSEAGLRCTIEVPASASGDHGEALTEIASDSSCRCDDEIDCEDEDELDEDDDGDEETDGQAQAQERCSEPVSTQDCANSLEVSSDEVSTSMLRVFGTVVRGAARTERQYPRSGMDEDEWELPTDLEPAWCALRMDFEAGATLSFDQQKELAQRAKKLRDVQDEIAALRAELGMSRG